jgi:nicotinic acid mononucleotide adenylyltransferase
VALEFLHRSLSRTASRVALLPGAWNPPTLAHLEIARAAAAWADEVIFVIPRALPHKEFTGVPFAARAQLIRQLAEAEDHAAAVTTSGLYFEMAAEAAQTLGPAIEVALVCGRDAAERIATWDYGDPGVFERMLTRHPLLVASRDGLWPGAAQYAGRVVPLELDPALNLISSTEVRRRITNGEDWNPLVPASLHAEIARLYPAHGQ